MVNENLSVNQAKEISIIPHIRVNSHSPNRQTEGQNNLSTLSPIKSKIHCKIMLLYQINVMKRLTIQKFTNSTITNFDL